MIRQDYIIRMIQEIFAAIANLILRRKHISKSDWEEYESTARQVLEVTPQQLEEMDGQTILEKYSQEKDGMEKTELAAIFSSIMAEDTENLVPNPQPADSVFGIKELMFIDGIKRTC